jgi:hypothetical protein
MALALVGVLTDEPTSGQNRPPEPVNNTDQPVVERAIAPPLTTTGPTPNDVAKPSTVSGLEASPLDTILMRDAKGNLVPVVGMGFEEFEQLLRAKKGLAPAAAPAYTIEAVSLVGKAAERLAEFQMTVTIRVREPGWIRVPLHLATAVIREPLKHEGPGECFLSSDENAGGYACWLKGNDSRPHVVSLSLFVALTSVGDERRLAVTLPRATESALRLVVNSPGADVTLISGEGIATTRVLDAGRTEIAVLGAAGDLVLAWRAQRETEKTAVQLDASGEIAVRIQSEHRITSDARLRVRSYGAPLESFQVALPPGMELLQSPASGYRISSVGFRSPVGGTALQEQIVEVRLDKPAPAADVLIRAQREAETIKSPLAPARFEVIGAIRQRGMIDFSMDGEWQLDWQEDKTVHRIDLMPDAGRTVARYEYFQQPCGLDVKVSARPARVSVEPVHMVFIEPERVRIESQLKYRFRGARASGLTFDLGEWNFDRLSPDSLLDFPQEESTSPGTLHIPFRAGAAPPSEADWKLEAHRVLPRGSERLSLTFPRPLADVVAPATIMIFAADNVEIAPEPTDINGLSPDSLATRPMDKPPPTLVYRDEGGEEPARFVASLRKLVRTTNTSARAIVRLERQQIQVEQHIDYRVSHEPERHFVLFLPREVASSDSLDVLFSGQSLPIRTLPAAPGDDPRFIRLQFTTPTNQLGAFQIEARYALPLAWDRASTMPWVLPLAMPADDGVGSFAGQQVEFQLTEDTAIEPVEEHAEDFPVAVAVRGALNTYSWESAAVFSPWLIAPGRAALVGSAHVSQMWVQTWLTPQVRHERVALRVNTLQDTLRLRLPVGVRLASVLAAVDAERVEARSVRSERVVTPEISVPLKNRGQDCVVEVWYSLDPPTHLFGTCHGELRTAQVVDAEAPRRAFWQLVVPDGEHLLQLPREMSAEMAWSPDYLRLQRRPLLDQRQLESWMKASRQDALPAGANEYLFGSLAQWPTLSITAASRLVIVSIASFCVLAIGLLLLNLAWLRSPLVLFIAAIALVASAVVWPEAAILISQGSLLGIVIGTALLFWNWVIRKTNVPDSRRAALTSTKSGTSPSTHTGAKLLESGSRWGTTHRAPLVEARP